MGQATCFSLIGARGLKRLAWLLWLSDVLPITSMGLERSSQPYHGRQHRGRLVLGSRIRGPLKLRLSLLGANRCRQRFVAQCARVFQSHCKTLILHSGDANDALARGHTSRNANEPGQEFNAFGAQFGCVLLVADSYTGTWAETAVRRTDVVIAAGCHGADPQPNA